ncbi:MAG: transglutaminase domain-containing protein [Bacteroidales bacterium]|nr:transglutaminase domain-containing protein [Bacteroidales bacterium]
MKTHYIPLNKYDTVIEHFDGSISIPPHEKKRYLFIAQHFNDIYFLNNIDGCLYTYSLEYENLTQINTHNTDIWKNKIGITFYQDFILTFDAKTLNILWFEKNTLRLIHQTKLNININHLFVENDHLWVTERESAKIIQYQIEQTTLTLLNSFNYKGIGNTSLYIINDELYITDSEENTIRCYYFDGSLKFEAITPFIDPIGQIYKNQQHFILYGGLVNEVGYDNRCWQEQKPFLHAIKIQTTPHENYNIVSTNAFEIDFIYEENFFENELQHYSLPMTIQLAIPPDTLHQKVLKIVHLGLPFEIIEINQKKYAQYTIHHPFVKSIGFRATLQLTSIKINPKNNNISLDTTNQLTPEEENELDLNNPYFNQFIIHDELDNIEKAKKLRNILYSKLEYKKNIDARNFEEVLKDGYGTCGDYTALMLIFYTLNHIACQSVGGYKVPRFYNATNSIMSIYYNHAWIEVFDNKNAVSLPIESSSDNKEYQHRFCEGQFLGIDWTHIKLYNGKAFPHLLNIPSHPNIHPFDLLKKASVFAIIKKEL